MDIVSLHRQGLSIKAIARRLDISRNTVRLALRRKEPPVYRRPEVPSKLDPHKDYLVARLAEFPELSAEALFEEIGALGYTGEPKTGTELMRARRRRRRSPGPPEPERWAVTWPSDDGAGRSRRQPLTEHRGSFLVNNAHIFN